MLCAHSTVEGLPSPCDELESRESSILELQNMISILTYALIILLTKFTVQKSIIIHHYI